MSNVTIKVVGFLSVADTMFEQLYLLPALYVQMKNGLTWPGEKDGERNWNETETLAQPESPFPFYILQDKTAHF